VTSTVIETVDQPGSRSDHRWQPTRAGLLNVWRYWDEVFEFYNGRLLLRGPNGSGKSLGLELLLPFLLDANAQPGRLSSAARSRGGLYDRIMAGSPSSNRAGFMWVEFARDTDYFTIGARVRASASTRRADTTFFTTTRRVGETLHLLDADRAPLERKALIQAVGTSGRVSDTGQEHREAVRGTLFPEFTPDRYDALITAMLALRKEKLSQDLNLDKMSEILTHALAPLEEHDLHAVAEGFERLDRRRDELEALEAELVVVRRLVAARRRYARTVAARIAGEVRAAASRRDTVTRRHREALHELDSVEVQIQKSETEADAARSRAIIVDAEISAIQGSDAYRDGAALADLAAQADRLEAQVETERERHATAAEIAARREAERVARDQAQAAASTETTAAHGEVRTAALHVGADMLVANDANPLELHGWLTTRREGVREMRGLLAEHGGHLANRDRAVASLDKAETQLEDRRSELEAAQDDLHTALRDYQQLLEDWIASSRAVGADRLRAALAPTTSQVFDSATDQVRALAGALAELDRTITAELAVAERELQAHRDTLATQRAELDEQRQELEATTVVEPQAAAWRSDRRASKLAGNPLWELVEVVSSTDSATVDAVESALDAIGLLDAWVTPDGSVDVPDSVADLLIGMTASSMRPARSLRDVLEPLDPKHCVGDVLASIPLAESANDHHDGSLEIRIGRDGTFRIGPAAGRTLPAPAQLLGAAARERRRLERIEELTSSIAIIDRELAENERQRNQLHAHRNAVTADFSARPTGAGVDTASGQLQVSAARVDDAEAARAAARIATDAAEEHVRTSNRAVAAMGAQHGLPTNGTELDELVTRLDRFDATVTGWSSHIDRHQQAVADAERAATEANEANELAAQAEHHLRLSSETAASARARVEAIQASVGAAYGDLLEQLGALEAERGGLRDRSDRLQHQLRSLATQAGTLGNVVEQATADRAAAEEHREAVHQRFLDLGADGLLHDADVQTVTDEASSCEAAVHTTSAEEATVIDDDAGTTAVLAAARTLAAELSETDVTDEALERSSARLQETLHTARSNLGGRVDLDDRVTEHGWWLLTASTQGVPRSSAQLQSHLNNQLHAGRSELQAEEEALFERTLAGSIRQALADRIRQANALVDDINAQLDAVRTAAGGVGVKLKWAVDDAQPAVVKAARSLLLRDPASLSDDDRTSLQDFVRARVEQARVDLGVNAPWQERLRESLDYRYWHRFSLQVAHRDWQGMKPATDRLLSGLSTGERSITLHLPMLASIAAHYASTTDEGSTCPRLILLDELFAGVDEANRAQLFGTFSTWDLDAVFTSDHEWCAYATLDGIAIHFLQAGRGDEPVTSTRFTWDGQVRRQASLTPVG